MNDLALDISSWQRRPRPSWFEQIAAAGYRLAIVQAWGSRPGAGSGPNPDCEYQLQQFRAAGLDTHIYIVIPPDDSTTKTGALIESAVAAAGNEFDHVTYLWPDIEGRGLLHPAPMERLLDAFENARSYRRPVGLYTNEAGWVGRMGSLSVRMPDPLPVLWEAQYVFDSGLGPSTPPSLDWFFMGFGGWTQRGMIQYAGTVPTFGVGADLNVVSYARLGLVAAEPEEALTMGQFEELRALIDGNEADITALQGEVTALKQRAPTPPAPPPPPPAGRKYTVKSGDTLSAIAQQFYGDATRWRQIYTANRRLIGANPNFIRAGQELTIP